MFRKEWPTSAALYLPNSAPPPTGKLFRNPGLALGRTSACWRNTERRRRPSREKRIDCARDAWYRGFVAEAVDAFCHKGRRVFDLRPAPLRRHDRRRHGGVARAGRSAGRLRLSRIHGAQGRAVGSGAGAAAAACAAQRPSIWTILTRPGQSSYTRSSKPASLPMPTARPGMATRILLTCRWRRCSARPTTMPRRKLIDSRARLARSASRQSRRAASSASRQPGAAGSPRRPGSASRRSARSTASASRRRARWARSPAIPATSTSSTAGATRSSATPSGGWPQRSPVSPGLGFCLGTRLQDLLARRGDRQSSLAPGRRPAAARCRLTLAAQGRRACHGVRHAGRRRPGPVVDPACCRIAVHHGMNLQEAIDCPEFNTATRRARSTARRRAGARPSKAACPRRPLLAAKGTASRSARTGPAGA